MTPEDAGDPRTGARSLRRPRVGNQGPILAAVASGGAIGATARHAAEVAWPMAPDRFPWTAFWINVIGCALIGALMTTLSERGLSPRLLRPFLGTGVLGGFTTFSAYAVDVQRLADSGRIGTALALLAVTPPAALAGVWSGGRAARRVTGPSGRRT
ncbi:fluoride efflux transporter FluC [Streptomyces sp. WMMC905]|uniref:fluoride efflux transporter FluC n=1 Tax=Streptomyces sp. WMMC905 TaxID=3404123 RepID=UPI003B9675BD